MLWENGGEIGLRVFLEKFSPLKVLYGVEVSAETFELGNVLAVGEDERDEELVVLE